VSEPGPVEETAETLCIFGQHYPRSFGGGVPSFVSDLMEDGGRFRTGLAALQLTFLQRGDYVPFHFSDGRTVRDGSDGQRERWELRFSDLPKRKFQRQKRRLSLQLRGDPRLDYRDSVYLTNITREDVRIGAEMLRDALTYVQSTLKRRDGVDLSALIAVAASLAQRDWPSDEALRESCRLAYEKDRARIAAMDPWSRCAKIPGRPVRLEPEQRFLAAWQRSWCRYSRRLVPTEEQERSRDRAVFRD
jgi:hypothetical protein